MKFTDDQQRVIDARNSNILVAAAAGSGKTAVLVERIIKKITDIDNPVDIDRLLIVTYTSAAAAQMRERISKAVAAKLEEYPDNRFYWGLPLRFHYNIFDITELTIKDDEIQAPEIGLGTIRRSFPNGELGLSFGRQIQQGGFITRHEVFFLWGFCNFLQFQGTVGENIMSSIWEKVYSEHLITIGYNVSFGYESIY